MWRVKMWRENLDWVGLGLCMILLCQLQDRRGRHPNTSGTMLSDERARYLCIISGELGKLDGLHTKAVAIDFAAESIPVV